jgi:hypothetical protein
VIIKTMQKRGRRSLAVRRSEQEFGQQQSTLVRRELSNAIAETRAVLASPTHASITNLRDKHLAHSLTESRREREGWTGRSDEVRRRAPNAQCLAEDREVANVLSEGPSFDFEDSRKINRASAEALWRKFTFDIKW